MLVGTSHPITHKHLTGGHVASRSFFLCVLSISRGSLEAVVPRSHQIAESRLVFARPTA